MASLTAENQFREGLVALADGRPHDAVLQFEAAMREERRACVPRPQMRYLSYYGLSLAMSGGAGREAIGACETAARSDFFNPDLLLNLGKVYLMAGKTNRALEVFERGLKVDRSHRGLQAALKKADRRNGCMVPWLGRQNPVNYWLGRAGLAPRPGRGLSGRGRRSGRTLRQRSPRSSASRTSIPSTTRPKTV